MLEEIPLTRPETPLLDSIDSPADLKSIDVAELDTLARELRLFLLYSVGQTGGHFGAGLGVVELTIALHHVFNTPEDRLVWDVGHQAYPHKIPHWSQGTHAHNAPGGWSRPPFPAEPKANSTRLVSAIPAPQSVQPWA
jgi:hypothetical protein